MPHFSESGSDMVICQVCGGDFDSALVKMTWRTDITNNPRAGNVCESCVKAHDNRPMGLFEYCKKESGLSDPEAIRRYMNRHYGHG